MSEQGSYLSDCRCGIGGLAVLHRERSGLELAGQAALPGCEERALLSPE